MLWTYLSIIRFTYRYYNYTCRSNIISRVQQELVFDLLDRISVVDTQIHTQLQIGRRLRDGGLITE